jgi:hypothetical protein
LNWTPGIGDPTLVGLPCIWWLASPAGERHGDLLCRFVAEERDLRGNRFRCCCWVLASNKQLDLQSELTELGRRFARAQGWYDHHRLVQVAFIVFVGLVTIVALIIVLIWVRQAPVATWVGLIGAAIIVAFVLIRASSFHRIDFFWLKPWRDFAGIGF